MFFDEGNSDHGYMVVFELDMEIRSVTASTVNVLSDVLQLAVVTAAGANVSQRDVSLLLTDAELLTSRTPHSFDAHIVIQRGFSTGSEAQRFTQGLERSLAQRGAEAWSASLVAAARELCRRGPCAGVSSFDGVEIQGVDSEASVISPPSTGREAVARPDAHGRPAVAGPAGGALAVGPLAGTTVVSEGRLWRGAG